MKLIAEPRQLPPIDLVTFDGNYYFWPKFIENFKFKISPKTNI